MNITRRVFFLNQSTGTLFYDLILGITKHYQVESHIYAGKIPNFSDILGALSNLIFHKSPKYNRDSKFSRIFSWIKYLFFCTPIILKAKKGDIFLLVTNPPILPPWVWFLSQFKDIKFFILVYDIYPDVLISTNIISSTGLFARLYKKLNLLTFKRAEVVITLGKRMANLLAYGDNALKNKIFVVPPWIDTQSIVPISKAENPETSNYVPEDKIVVLYSGNFGVSHDIESILEAAYLLKDDPQIFFLLFGGGEKFKMAESFVFTNKLSNINIWPFQPYDKIKYTLPLGDIAIVSVNEGMEDLILPSKAFSYMAAGSALIGISNEPSELSELFKMGNFGKIVKPKCPETLANSIKELANEKIILAEMSKEARDIVEKFYSREEGVKKFIDILENSDLFKN